MGGLRGYMLTVYTTPTCPKCKLLMSHLDSIQRPYQVANLLADLLYNADLMAPLHEQGISFRSAPVLQVGNSFYGPEQMFEGGKLDEKKLERLL